MYKLYNLKTLKYINIVPPTSIIIIITTTSIEQPLLVKIPSISNNIIIIPKNLNLKANKLM